MKPIWKESLTTMLELEPAGYGLLKVDCPQLQISPNVGFDGMGLQHLWCWLAPNAGTSYKTSMNCHHQNLDDPKWQLCHFAK